MGKHRKTKVKIKKSQSTGSLIWEYHRFILAVSTPPGIVYVALLQGGRPVEADVKARMWCVVGLLIVGLAALAAVQANARGQLCNQRACRMIFRGLWLILAVAIGGIVLDRNHRLDYLFGFASLALMSALATLNRLPRPRGVLRFGEFRLSVAELLAIAVSSLNIATSVSAIDVALDVDQPPVHAPPTTSPPALATTTTAVTTVPAEVETSDSHASATEIVEQVDRDCGPDPWLGASTQQPFDPTSPEAISVVDRLVRTPYTLAGCPTRVERIAGVNLLLVETTCPDAWDACSRELLVADASGAVTVVHAPDIDTIGDLLRRGSYASVSDRHFDGHSWWYDLSLSTSTRSCHTFASSFDGTGVLLDEPEQYLFKDLMVRNRLVLEPQLVIDGASGQRTVRVVPSKPVEGDGYVEFARFPGDASVTDSSVVRWIGMRADNDAQCRTAVVLDELAPTDPLLSKGAVSGSPGHRLRE